VRISDRVRREIDRMRELGVDGYLLERDRVEAWLTHLYECDMEAELESVPELRGVHFGTRRSLGRVRLHNAAFGCIELFRSTTTTTTDTNLVLGGKSTQKVSYEDHFIIDVPERKLADPPKAMRKPRRAYWLVGRVLGYWPAPILSTTYDERVPAFSSVSWGPMAQARALQSA